MDVDVDIKEISLARKRKMTTKNPAVPGVSTSNRFQALSDDGASTSKKVRTVDKLFKPPPVVITGDGAKSDLHGFMKSIAISSYFIKNISIGTKVFLSSEDDYSVLTEQLKANHFEFFSHGRKDQKQFRVVLCGLPEMNTCIIESELKEKYNLDTSKTTLIKSKFNNPNNAMYFISFSSKEVTLNSLNQIKSISNVIVRWRKYIPKRRGPTQCTNCGMFGHGSTYCHRKRICIHCANDHASDACPFTGNNQSAEIAFRCFNCMQKKLPFNHSANDENCPCRAEYLSLINRSNGNRMNQNSNRINNVRKPGPGLRENLNDVNAFPSLKRRSNAGPPETIVKEMRQQRVNNRVTMAQALSGCNNNTRGNTSNSTNSNSNDLFSSEELFDIFVDAVQRLEACSTKLEQMKVIASLVRHAI